MSETSLYVAVRENEDATLDSDSHDSGLGGLGMPVYGCESERDCERECDCSCA
jgi:hypothetical protein